MFLTRKLKHYIALSCCLLFVGSYAIANDSCSPLTKKQIQKNQHLSEDAIRYAPYAIFSNNAYHRVKPLPLPEGWREVSELRNDATDSGLELTVFEKHEGDNLIEVVVAFRGTDERKDWIQNMVPFFRKQVPHAEIEFGKVLDHYKGQNAKITTTGHSLGGGLALHMSFTHPDIDAIAFNSSPVTKAGKDPIMTNKRVSIWESGELLQGPRNSVNWARERWRYTKRIEFRFLHGSPIKLHLMEGFALNITKLGALTSKSLQAVIDQFCEQNSQTIVQTSNP